MRKVKMGGLLKRTREKLTLNIIDSSTNDYGIQGVNNRNKDITKTKDFIGSVIEMSSAKSDRKQSVDFKTSKYLIYVDNSEFKDDIDFEGCQVVWGNKTLSVYGTQHRNRPYSDHFIMEATVQR